MKKIFLFVVLAASWICLAWATDKYPSENDFITNNIQTANHNNAGFSHENGQIPQKELDYINSDDYLEQTLNDKNPVNITLDEDGETCETAYIVDSIPFHDSGNTCDFLNDCDIPFSDNSDVIYVMIIDESMALEVSLLGSSYDTKLTIFNDECCTGPGTEFAYNDDDIGPQSRIEAYFETGTYYIVVDGYGSHCGDYILSITEGDIPTPPPCHHYFVGPGEDNWNFWTSDQEIGPYIVYDNFWCNNNDNIGAVRWWGIDLHDTGYSWEECDEEVTEFEIKFYADVYGFPDTINPTCVCTVTPERNATGIIFNNGNLDMELIEYYAEFDACSLSEGWLSIQGTLNDGNACGFLWSVSNGGDGCSYQNRGGSLVQLNSDLARYIYEGSTAIDKTEPLPARVDMLTNYPNPFNAITVIAYNLDAPSDVSLDIYDIGGRLVITLDSGAKNAGLHQISWDGQNAEGSDMSSGIYFYKLSTGDMSLVNRMIFLK